jgi:hypothetical protein
MGKDGMHARLKLIFGKAPLYEQLQELHVQVERERREQKKREKFFEDKANTQPVLTPEAVAGLRVVPPEPEPVPEPVPEPEPEDMGMKARPKRRHADDFRKIGKRGDNGSIYPDDFIMEVDQALQTKSADVSARELIESYGFPGATDFYRLRSLMRKRQAGAKSKPKPTAQGLAQDVVFGGRRAFSPARLHKAARDVLQARALVDSGVAPAAVTKTLGISWGTVQKYLNDERYLTDARRVLATIDAPAPEPEAPAPEPRPSASSSNEAVAAAIRMLLEEVPNLARLEVTAAPGQPPEVTYEIHAIETHHVQL